MHLYTLPDRLVAYFIYLITHQHKIIGFVTLHSQLGVCSIFKSVITNIPRMTGGEEKSFLCALCNRLRLLFRRVTRASDTSHHSVSVCAGSAVASSKAGADIDVYADTRHVRDFSRCSNDADARQNFFAIVFPATYYRVASFSAFCGFISQFIRSLPGGDCRLSPVPLRQLIQYGLVRRPELT